MDEGLRESLVGLVRRKFAGQANVVVLAEDIVQDAYIRLRTSKVYEPQKENYGYLSITCVRLAYRHFMAQSSDFDRVYSDDATGLGLSLVDETDVAQEIIHAEDAAAVLESLKTLRDVERVVITQRYYGDFSFNEIAEANGLKLNTVLSHHRRALGKLRPQLTKLLGIGNGGKSWRENIGNYSR